MTETKTKKEELKPTLLQKLAIVQANLKAPKSQYNKFGNYYYRNSEDILEAVKPYIEELEFTLTLTDEVQMLGNRFYVKAIAIFRDATGEIQNVAWAREVETKTGMDGAQITGASSSYARKYALNGLFAIDDTKDADSGDNKEEKPKVEKPITKNVTKEVYEDKNPADLFNGELPDIPNPHMDERVSFRDESGEVARDSHGLTACTSCGKAVLQKVEDYSLQKYGKVLCYDCQRKQ